MDSQNPINVFNMYLEEELWEILIAMNLALRKSVNSLLFARDLFGDFRNHIKIAKINTCKRNSGI